MDSGVDLLAVVVLGSGTDSFHRLVFVSGSEFSLFTELLSLGDDGDSLAFWAGFVEEVDDFLVLKGGWGIGLDGGESSSVDLSQQRILLSGSGEDKVHVLLFDVNSDGDLPWDSDSESSDCLDGVGGSEWRQMVVDGGESLEVESKPDFVVPGDGRSGLVRSDLNVGRSDSGDSGDGGDWDSKFAGLFSGDSGEEHHSDEFLVVGGSLELSQLLDELWDGGDGLLVSSMVGNNTSVDEDSDFNPDWLRLSFLNSDLLEDSLDLVEIDDSSGHGHESASERLANTFHSDEEGKVVGSESGGLSIESNVDGSWEKAVSVLLDGDGGHVSEVVLTIMVVADVSSGVFSLGFPLWDHLESGLGVGSDARQAWSGSSAQALQQSLDEVLDFGVSLSPEGDGDFLEDVLFRGSKKDPFDSSVPQLGVFMSIVEDGEEFVVERLSVFLQQRLKSRHGGGSDRSVVALVLKDSQQFLGSWEKVDVSESDDSGGLVFEGGGRVDLVGPVFDPFGQKSRFLASALFAGSAQKRSEGEFDDSSVDFGVVGLDKSFQFLEEVLSGVPDVVGKRSDQSANDEGLLGVGNDVPDDEGSRSGSGHNQSVQEDFLFSLISSLDLVVDLGEMVVVHGSDEGKEGEGSDLVEFLGVLEHIGVLKGHMDFLDVFDESVFSSSLTSSVEVESLVVEEERMGLLDVFIFVEVIFESEFQVVVRLRRGWSSNGSRLDFLQGESQERVRVLSVTISSEDVVDKNRSNSDALGDQMSVFDDDIVSSVSGGVKEIPGVIIRAVLD